MVQKATWAAAGALLVTFVARTSGAATLEPHTEVQGKDVANVEVRAAGQPWQATAWDELDQTQRQPGSYDVRIAADAPAEGATLWLPVCAGRSAVTIDGRRVSAPNGPIAERLPPGSHEAVVTIAVSRYEKRIACGDRPRIGAPRATIEGLGILAFSSPHAAKGGGSAVVYVPPGHDVLQPARVLVGAHPWNGTMWTYAAYAQLLSEARARDVVLLMPSGLGNSLYTADAEDEVLRSIDALSSAIAVDPRAVSIWGASMGGAGATTIAFHHPDRFAGVASFFGDSKYDLQTYVRSILPDEAAAHRVNALDVVENARHLPVLLVHGEDDRTSPIRQSEILAEAMRARGFSVRFERVPGFGHSGALVARYLARLVAAAATARTPANPPRVTYRSARPSDTGAYGVRIARSDPAGDAFVDVEQVDGAVHVRRSEGVRAIWLSPGALGTSPAAAPPVVQDAAPVEVRWGTPP
jgi:enterochelin esterase-like enzyme